MKLTMIVPVDLPDSGRGIVSDGSNFGVARRLVDRYLFAHLLFYIQFHF